MIRRALSRRRGGISGVRPALALAFALLACATPVPVPAAALDAGPEAEQAYTQAVQAIQAEQWAQAELLLERTIMLNPEHAGARLELAGLLVVRGRADAARALIESLVADPRTPPAYRERLENLLARARRNEPLALPGDAGPAQIRSETFLAWAQNPLARTDLRQLTLTLPDGALTLPLTQNAHPGGLAGVWISRAVPGGWTLEANHQHLLGADALGASRVAAYGPLTAQAADGAALQVRWLAQTQRSYDGLTRHSAGLSVGGPRWAVTGGAFTEPALQRHGTFVRLEGAARPAPDWRTNMYAATEHAASGPPSHWTAGATAAWSATPRWTLYAHGSYHRDLSGYSPLLSAGAARSMLTLNMALERAWAVQDNRWQVVARLQAGQRWSNIDLFTYRDAGVQISLRQRWN